MLPRVPRIPMTLQEAIDAYNRLSIGPLRRIGSEHHGACPLCDSDDGWRCHQRGGTLVIRCHKCWASWQEHLEALGLWRDGDRPVGPYPQMITRATQTAEQPAESLVVGMDAGDHPECEYDPTGNIVLFPAGDPSPAAMAATIPTITVKLGPNGPIGPVPDGVVWSPRPFGRSIVRLYSAEDVHLRVTGSGSGSADREGDGAGDAIREGAGAGNARRYGFGAGNAVRLGDGAGDAIHSYGYGTGDAIRDGSGDGDAVREGDGAGDALRDGAGLGNARRYGYGVGNAVRLGDGAGDALHNGFGAGDAIRDGSGDGSAIRDGSGTGDAVRCGDGTGDACRNGSGTGTAIRGGTGDAPATCA